MSACPGSAMTGVICSSCKHAARRARFAGPRRSLPRSPTPSLGARARCAGRPLRDDRRSEGGHIAVGGWDHPCGRPPLPNCSRVLGLVRAGSKPVRWSAHSNTDEASLAARRKAASATPRHHCCRAVNVTMTKLEVRCHLKCASRMPRQTLTSGIAQRQQRAPHLKTRSPRPTLTVALSRCGRSARCCVLRGGTSRGKSALCSTVSARPCF
jgi:hypothetical protein